MDFKSLIEWQKRTDNTLTRLVRSTNTFGCSNCHKIHKPCDNTEKNAVICAEGSNVSFFCTSCWDSEPNWQCSHCESTPDDKDVISCDCCGQWTHNNCEQYIDVTEKYICTQCKNSDLGNLKSVIFDKNIALSDANNATKKWKSKFEHAEQQEKNHGVVSAHLLEEIEEVHKQKNLYKVELKKLQHLQKTSSKSMATTLSIANNATNEWKGKFEHVEQQEKERSVVSARVNGEFDVVRKQNKLYKHAIKKLQRNQQCLNISMKKHHETNTRLVLTVNKLRKRTREHDGMVDLMNNYVKRHKPEWSYSVPSGLTPLHVFLWKKYECKQSVHGGQYGVNGIHSNIGNIPLFSSINDMFKAVHKIYMMTSVQKVV